MLYESAKNQLLHGTPGGPLCDARLRFDELRTNPRDDGGYDVVLYLRGEPVWKWEAPAGTGLSLQGIDGSLAVTLD